ncbi:MAG: hypothetical protein O3B70_09265 [Bacteroidetes bacterium]|nr:hypothetical protein [Bacteroidota bacterium]MDA0904511.1 hypothetical protein [Bacteroidota bacterium]MDA1242255.1 hypothetical protein [Bacteroidota bacterium]
MTQPTKNFLYIALLGAFVGGLVAFFMYNKPHKDYAGAEVAQAWTSEELVAWHMDHDASMHSEWTEKVMEVSGEVSEWTPNGLILAPGVVVVWAEGVSAPSTKPSLVTVKGRIVGYDDLFGEVRLDHGVLQ